MSRAASQDPIDKFRFRLTILGNNNFFNITGSNALDFKDLNQISAGFTEVSIPKVSVTEISYRENIDGIYFKKIAGLVKYDPVTLKRGKVAEATEFYEWYKLVNNDAGTLNSLSQAGASFGAVPFQQAKYRKEILISSLDRSGNMIRHWMLFNAFPVSYKGGDDLEASTETKLIEELVLTYETFLEVKGSTISEALEDVQTQIAKAAELSAAALAVGTAAGAFSNIF